MEASDGNEDEAVEISSSKWLREHEHVLGE